ncbi:hypothetical protein [Halobium salinum]|uniref:hypothetical protein n=1 Tax=Halobium salinum TaxID=1364940 RepID=UPI00226E8180|nr:hypothetical protein [Halobium salinum]
MNYAVLDLTLDAEAARDRVVDRVSGVSVRSADDRYEFLTPSGFHLAELSNATLPDGEHGSRLTYRTAMVSPVAASARRKAEAVCAALAPYRYRPGKRPRR